MIHRRVPRAGGTLRRAAGVAAAALALVVAPAAAQRSMFPDSFTNLKVLPKDISKEQLEAVMRSFAGGLGVHCDYCHVREGEGRQAHLHFSLDDKTTKKKARAMLQMVQAINGELLPKVPDRTDPPIRVGCITCHHGVSKPQTLDDVLARRIAESGIEAGLAAYDSLRQEYYGSGAYDFREGSLITLARSLATARQYDDAIRILELNAREYPRSAQTQFFEGEVLLQKGDSATARTKYQKALELDPRMEPARRRLQAMAGG